MLDIADFAVVGKHKHGKHDDKVAPSRGVYFDNFVVSGLYVRQ